MINQVVFFNLIATWKIGVILHKSIIPDPRYWPTDEKNNSSGTPNTIDKAKNWSKKMTRGKIK